ncbi:MAG: hypothetical protein AMJ78_10155 [Omnitrophica WOR_2 bacterium SM23_29]|nr:MAG: hypothetical protein AMJ78_10155 [Omnitrophica WOR_2 bacterium SM23_29]
MWEDDLYFCKEINPKIFFVNFSKTHRKIFNVLNSQYPLALVLAPRKTGKTPCTKFGYILKRICFDLESYIIYASESQDEAKKHAQHIIKNIEDNERLHHYFGKLVDRRRLVTRQGECQFTNGIFLGHKGALQQSRGTQEMGEGSLTVSPPSLIVVDDPQSNKNVKSETLREDTSNWFEEEVIYSLAKKWLHPKTNRIDRGKVRFIGTSLHPDCLAERKWRDQRFYKVRYAALINKNGNPDHINGKSYWESMFPTEELYAERDAAEAAGTLSSWLQERQNIPRILSDQKFNPNDIMNWDVGGNRFEMYEGEPVFIQEEDIGVSLV